MTDEPDNRPAQAPLPPTHPTRIDAVAEAHFLKEVELSPWKQMDVGVGPRAARLDDYSPAGLSAADDLNRNTLAELDRAVEQTRVARATTADDEITEHALRERLSIARDMHRAGLDARTFNVIESAPQLIRDFFDMVPIATREDWETNLACLRDVGRALAGYRETVDSTMRAGMPPTDLQASEVLGQAETLAAPGGHFDRFARQAEHTPAVDERLTTAVVDAASEARAAYGEFADYLRASVLPHTHAVDACGPEEYALHSRFYLGEDIDVDDTYQWALEDLARIDAQQKRIVREMNLADSVPATIEALDRSPAHRLHGAGALLEWMQQTSDEALHAVGREAFDIPLPLRTLECRVQEDGTGVVFYSRPTADFSRPGRMWWSVPSSVDTFASWREKTTVYHEGVPGHHLQYGIATLMTHRLNSWRRQGCWVSGHGEGWALYAEQLMADMGFHEDPADMLGMLDSQRLRTARICIDLGVHCQLRAPSAQGGGVWDRSKAWQFLTANVAMNEPTRRFEHARYMGWPGQASSYRVGERLWRSIKDETRQRKRAAFSEREFHSRALETGSVGLSTLRRAARSF